MHMKDLHSENEKQFFSKKQNKDDFWWSYTFLMTLCARKKSLIHIATESASILIVEFIVYTQKS